MTEPAHTVEPERWVADLAARINRVTPARVFTGRAGSSYRTGAALQLRADHAAAQDAVAAEIDCSPAGLAALTGGRPAALTHTMVGSKPEFLTRPDLGRRLSAESRDTVAALTAGADLQIVLGDGLSARALTEQAPPLLDLLLEGAATRGWSVGELVVVRYCRVGILNDIGALLDPAVVVLLIGERPGLATASSLSAYLAYRPRPGDTDERRNLVANIHPRGLTAPLAAERILALAQALRDAQCSGVSIKEPDATALGATARATPSLPHR
jgi:ethanolamine ammonia-lyase small subunit